MSDFPHITLGSGDLAAHIADNKPAIDAQLASAGAVLFRGFAVPDTAHFDAAVVAYGEENFPYAESLSNAVRVNVTERVFTANEAPPTTTIHLHHEMAQTPIYPSKLFFYCEIAPDEGGATPVCRSDWLAVRLREVDPQFHHDLASKGVKYTNSMPGSDDAGSGQGRSWRSTLGVDDRAGAEARLTDLGYDWEWQDGDVLKMTTPVLTALRTLEDGREVFFNQLIAAFRGWSDSRNTASKSVTFGDGSPLPESGMHAIVAIAEELVRDVAWQAGDVALLDNYTVMHGRRPFAGKRRVLASLIG